MQVQWHAFVLWGLRFEVRASYFGPKTCTLRMGYWAWLLWLSALEHVHACALVDIQRTTAFVTMYIVYLFVLNYVCTIHIYIHVCLCEYLMCNYVCVCVDKSKFLERAKMTYTLKCCTPKGYNHVSRGCLPHGGLVVSIWIGGHHPPMEKTIYISYIKT